jgi:predicted RNase H-like HicB family nuclease
VLIYPGEDGYWVAECPSLPGCISRGKTEEEAMADIKETILDIKNMSFCIQDQKSWPQAVTF